MKTALIIVDIQRDYFPGGKMEVVGAMGAGEAAGRLLGAFREKGLPVVHVQHLSTREGATFFLPGTEGVLFHPLAAPLPGEPVITKHYPNSFRETRLRGALEETGADELVICGMMSHMCIDATVRAAVDLDYRCIVASDACATRNLEFEGVVVPSGHVHAAFMAALGSVYARIMKSAEIIAPLRP